VGIPKPVVNTLEDFGSLIYIYSFKSFSYLPAPKTALSLSSSSLKRAGCIIVALNLFNISSAFTLAHFA
jgi:hypothetical protein